MYDFRFVPYYDFKTVPYMWWVSKRLIAPNYIRSILHGVYDPKD